MSNHGRRASEIKNVLEFEGENCCIPGGKACFLKCIKYSSKKDFSMEYFEFKQSYKGRTYDMTCCKCRIFVKDMKLLFGIYDVKIKRIFPRIAKQRDVCVYIQQKNHYCISGRRIEKTLYLMG